MKNAARLLFVTALSGTVSILTSCSGGSSGGGRMYVESCTLGCTNGQSGDQVSCGIVNTYQNQDVAVVFSQPVSIGSLAANNAFQVIDIVTGGVPPGTRLVDPSNSRRAIFRPKLSFDSSGNPSYGFGSNQTYQIRIPGTQQSDVGPFVESQEGQLNSSRMLCTITTSQGLIDPVPGAPTVSIFVRALGFANPVNLDSVANLEDVLTTSTVTFVFNDLMNVGTLVQPSTGLSPFISVKVDPDGNLSTPGDQVPVGGTYQFSINQSTLTTSLVFTPFGGFPSAGTGNPKRKIVVDVPTSVKDLSGNAVLNAGRRTFVPEVVVFNPVSLPTGGEQFTNQSNTDTLRTGADWGGGRLVAGVGGGSGRFGDLIITDNQVRTFYTSELPSELRIRFVRNIRGADQARLMFGNNALNIVYKVPANATALDIPIRNFLLDSLKETINFFRSNPGANPVLAQLTYELEGIDTIVCRSATPGSALNGTRVAVFPDFALTLVGFNPASTVNPLDTNWGGGVPYVPGTFAGGLDNGLGLTTTAGALINNLDSRLFLTNLALGATIPDPVITDGVLEFSFVEMRSNSSLTVRGDNPFRLFSRGNLIMADTAIIDAQGSDLGGHPSDSPIGQYGSVGGPGAGRGGQGADRPDNTGSTLLNLANCTTANCPGGGTGTSQLPIINQGIVNVGATVDGRPGQGVGGAVGFGGVTGLGDGTGGSRWPLSFPTNAAQANYNGLDVIALDCTSQQLGAAGAGGAFATDGGAGVTVSGTATGVLATNMAPANTAGGAFSELGLEPAATPGDRRALRPSMGFLRGGSGGGGGGSGLFGTHTTGTVGGATCVGVATTIDRYRSHSGAGGGGGGGAVQIVAGRIASIDGRIDVTGGDGGDVLSSNVIYGQHATPGGGGSGGAILVQSKTVDLAPIQNRLIVVGGGGGTGPFTSVGGIGGTGLVRIEDNTGLDRPTAAVSVAPTGPNNSIDWLSVGTWSAENSGPDAHSGAQSCWIRATGNFFNLTFESDTVGTPGWDMDVILDLGAGEVTTSYRNSTIFSGQSPQQFWGNLIDDGTLVPPQTSAPIIVRFQGAKAVAGLSDPCNVDVNDINTVAQNSLTPWVQHPDEFNSNLLAIKPDMIRFQIVFDRAHPDFNLVKGVTNLSVRVVPD
ncbi:MAG: hypothetical protein NTV21_20410 [Planctomycetota bacterium]|nr:hypothetical protein [Planctomycetota bacterium]